MKKSLTRLTRLTRLLSRLLPPSIEADTSAIRIRGLSEAEFVKINNALWRPLRKRLAEAVRWKVAVDRVIAAAITEQRWIPTEKVDRLLALRPQPGLFGRVKQLGSAKVTEQQLQAAALLDVDLAACIAATNERIAQAELASRKPFFDNIETSPLTPEQARAVVTFDNRVQILAAAGSGKTSVMIARAAYAVDRGFVPADRILMLAFNKNAAKELQERVNKRFAAAGISSEGLRALTFHSFGLEVIRSATGKKQRTARWVGDNGKEVKAVLDIVDQLRETSWQFRYQWDLYRLLFARAPTNLDADKPDHYNSQTRQSGYKTFGGDVVKSHGERLIADFLYLNGLDYEYERPYLVDVSDSSHSQYRPDFYYPKVDAWHEHWALDENGNPPATFNGYAESMTWKRNLHSKHQTTLIESTWSDVVFGNGLQKLEADLTRLGLTFDWNPARPAKNEGVRPMDHEELARFIRTFMAQVKSNKLTRSDLEQRLTTDLRHLKGFRSQLFLDIYWAIHAEWDRRLSAEYSVDFEDMLAQAADHLEAGRYESPYKLIMVDEFQDASRARARLVSGLLKTPGCYLLAVGDDWQSINRFAGADMSVMTEFESWFGKGPQLALTTTFRCTQTICDVASNFVSKNPAQFQKPMRSAKPDAGPPLTVVRTNDPTDAIAALLNELSSGVANGSIQPGPSGSVTVDILGRYRFDEKVLPANELPHVDVTFRTVHSSKGLEADYVVIPGMGIGTYGFPCTTTDDPVLALAMSTPESFEHAEERRLLYVALTRARRHVTLITPPQKVSPFVVELVEHDKVIIEGEVTTEVCGCKRGLMIERTGPRGSRFMGCSTFPACRETRSLTA